MVRQGQVFVLRQHGTLFFRTLSYGLFPFPELRRIHMPKLPFTKLTNTLSERQLGLSGREFSTLYHVCMLPTHIEKSCNSAKWVLSAPDFRPVCLKARSDRRFFGRHVGRHGVGHTQKLHRTSARVHEDRSRAYAGRCETCHKRKLLFSFKTLTMADARIWFFVFFQTLFWLSSTWGE